MGSFERPPCFGFAFKANDRSESVGDGGGSEAWSCSMLVSTAMPAWLVEDGKVALLALPGAVVVGAEDRLLVDAVLPPAVGASVGSDMANVDHGVNVSSEKRKARGP